MAQETIEDKLVRMIETFRIEFNTLSIEERQKEQMISSLKKPCQIHIITSPYNNFHVLIITHLAALKDKTVVLINLKPDTFLDKLYEFASNTTWNIVDDPEIAEFSANSFKKSIENIVINFGKLILRSQNIVPDGSSVGSMGLHNPKLAEWELSGNLAKIDFDEYVKQQVGGYKEDYARDKNKKTEQITESIPDQNTGLGTFFYPPILVGDFNPSLKDRIQEKEYDLLQENVILTNFQNHILVVTRGGMIGIESKDREYTGKVLNNLMATAVLFGLPLQAVRTKEIADVTFDNKTHRVTGSSWSGSSKRMELFQHHSFNQSFFFDVRNQISVEGLKSIIKTTELFMKNDEFEYILKLLLNAYTQKNNGDYSQSFITSWTIIEKDIYDLWMKKLISSRISKKSREDLDRWDLYKVLEILHLDKIIPDEDYYEFKMLQNLRNDVIHEGHEITPKIAEKCYNLSEEIVRKITNVNNKIKFRRMSI